MFSLFLMFKTQKFLRDQSDATKVRINLVSAVSTGGEIVSWIKGAWGTVFVLTKMISIIWRNYFFLSSASYSLKNWSNLLMDLGSFNSYLRLKKHCFSKQDLWKETCISSCILNCIFKADFQGEVGISKPTLLKRLAKKEGVGTAWLNSKALYF